MARQDPVVVYCDNQGEVDRLEELVEQAATADPTAPREIATQIGLIHQGFRWVSGADGHRQSLVVVAHHELFRRYTQKRRLRKVTASQGLMLESTNADLVAHQGSPTKNPAVRLETIRTAGELKIPFTSGILVGIGETPEERIASLKALAEVHARHGHLQEVILQNYVPHPRYYGREVAELADEAARRRWTAS